MRAVFVAAGLLVCFRGYSAFRLGLALTAFLVGVHVVLLRADLIPKDPPWLLPAVAVAVGVVAAALVHLAYRFGVALLGAAVFVSVALAFPKELPSEPVARLLILAFFGLLGALAAQFLERIVLSVATAAYGAFMVVAGLFSSETSVRLRLPGIGDTTNVRYPELFLAVWILLAVAGTLVQLYRSRPKE